MIPCLLMPSQWNDDNVLFVYAPLEATLCPEPRDNPTSDSMLVVSVTAWVNKLVLSGAYLEVIAQSLSACWGASGVCRCVSQLLALSVDCCCCG